MRTSAQAVKDETQASTWAHYKWVSNKVELCTRVHNLSWVHHRAVAPLEKDAQNKYLSLAKKNNWTEKEIRKEVKKHKRRKQ
jgi:hypothetical protein